MNVDNKTPLQSFINHKADTLMQCGNYSIDIPPLQEGEQYRFHFDATACVGCHCCEAACNEQNGNPAEVKWRRVGEMEGGVFPNTMQFFNSMSCNHCIDPACLNGCPTQSYIKFDNGVVFHDDDVCIGCQYCTWNCPYEVPVFNAERGIVTKCHMCVDKLDSAQTPACVQACPAGAIEIEVVNKEEWIKNDMAKLGVAPHLPDIEVTKPTTRYTLPDNLPNLTPADAHITKPAHAELPLVFMTVLTQMSMGAVVALFWSQILSLFGFSNLAQGNVWMALFAILPALIGLPLSALHLGRPILAGTAMKNIKSSWLSREALALGIFGGVGTVMVGAFWIESGFFSFVLALLASIAGIYGIYAQSMIYRIPARPAWNRVSTTKRFFGTSYMGLILVALTLSLQEFGNSAMVVLSLSLMVAGYQLMSIHEEKSFYHYLGEDQENFYQLNKTKILLESTFKEKVEVRYYTLIGFGLLLPLISMLFLANGSVGMAGMVLVVSLVGSLWSELLGRYLFYVSVVPLGLAGNFFAGNQRGS
jgi:Fe-S-cluster-containing dehydrogenase component/DMSO reductase anchor subunit